MTDEGNDENTITLAYPEADDYRLIHASGSRGGMQPGNDFKIDFVIDMNPPIANETLQVNEDGSLGEPLETERDHDVDGVREKQIGVMMAPDKAFSIAAWIIENIVNDVFDGETTESEIKELIVEHHKIDTEEEVMERQ